jgi:hypothetical protein
VTDTLTYRLPSNIERKTEPTPDLIDLFCAATDTVVMINVSPATGRVTATGQISTESKPIADEIMEWLAEPDALDWDHLDRIDAEGWRTG